MKGIYESLLLEGYCVNLVDKDLAQKYLRWISYVPEFWNIDENSHKSCDKLTKQETAYFEQFWEEQKKLVPLFTKFLYDGEKDSKTMLAVHNYVKSHDIRDLMFSKMDLSEQFECLNTQEELKVIDNEELTRRMNELKQIPESERTITEEFILTYYLIPAFNKMVEDRMKPILIAECSIEIDSKKPMSMLRK